MPPPRSAKRRLAKLANTEWEEEPQPSHPITQTTQLEQPTKVEEATNEQQTEQHQESPRPKRRRLDRKDGRGLVKDTTAPVNASAPTKPIPTLEIIWEP